MEVKLCNATSIRLRVVSSAYRLTQLLPGIGIDMNLLSNMYMILIDNFLNKEFLVIYKPCIRPLLHFLSTFFINELLIVESL